VHLHERIDSAVLVDGSPDSGSRGLAAAQLGHEDPIINSALADIAPPVHAVDVLTPATAGNAGPVVEEELATSLLITVDELRVSRRVPIRPRQQLGIGR
jgi:hypothetical protein